MPVENLFLVPKLFWPLGRLRSIENEVDLPEWTRGSLWLEHDSYTVEERGGSFKLKRVDYPRSTWVSVSRESERIWIPLYKTNMSVLTSAFLKRLLNEVWNRNYERERFSKYILMYILEKLRVHLLRSLNYSSISRLCDDIVGKPGFPSIVNFALVDREGSSLKVEEFPEDIPLSVTSAVVKKAIDRFIDDMVILDRSGRGMFRQNPSLIMDPKSLSFLLNRSILHAFLSSNSLPSPSYGWINYFLRMHVDESYITEGHSGSQESQENLLSQITGDAERFVRTMVERLSEEHVTPGEDYEIYGKFIESIYKLSSELSGIYEKIVSMLRDLAGELSNLRKRVGNNPNSHIHERVLALIGGYVGLLGLLSNMIVIPIAQSSIESLNILVIGDAFTTLMSFYNQYYLITDLLNSICSYLLHYDSLCIYLAEFGMRDKCLSLYGKIPFIGDPSEEIFKNLREFSKEIIKELNNNKEEFFLKLVSIGKFSPTVQHMVEDCKKSLIKCKKSTDCKNSNYVDAIRVAGKASSAMGQMRLLNGLTVIRARHASILTHGLLPNSLFRFHRKNRLEILKLSVKLLLSSMILAKLSLVAGDKGVLRLLLDHIDQVISKVYGPEITEKYEEMEEEERLEELIPELFEKVEYLFDMYSELFDMLSELSLIHI